jgi:hypothetical protein
VAEGWQRAVDELDVRNLLARFSQATDGGTVEEYGALLTEGATFDLGSRYDAPFIGREAVVAGHVQRRAEGVAGPTAGVRHMLSTTVVEVDGDRATARSHWQLFRTSGDFMLVGMGVYTDELIRTPDGWRLQRRVSVRD